MRGRGRGRVPLPLAGLFAANRPRLTSKGVGAKTRTPRAPGGPDPQPVRDSLPQVSQPSSLWTELAGEIEAGLGTELAGGGWELGEGPPSPGWREESWRDPRLPTFRGSLVTPSVPKEPLNARTRHAARSAVP